MLLSSSSAILSHPKRSKIKVLFEFSVLRPKLCHYRAVEGADGGYRMERRGATALKFKTYTWCGSRKMLERERALIDSLWGPLFVGPAK